MYEYYTRTNSFSCTKVDWKLLFLSHVLWLKHGAIDTRGSAFHSPGDRQFAPLAARAHRAVHCPPFSRLRAPRGDAGSDFGSSRSCAERPEVTARGNTGEMEQQPVPS